MKIRITKTLFFQLALLILVIMPFVVQAVVYYHYTNDDAYITYRFSRNLIQGVGPFFNAGEHVEGYTNFLQMLQTAVIIWLFGPASAPGIAKLLSVFYGAGCVVLTYLLYWIVFSGRNRRIPGYLIVIGALAASAMVSVSPAFAVNSTSGLETTMFTFLLCLGMVLGIREMQRERWRGSGVAFAAALLTRPEGSFLFAAFWAACAMVVASGLWSDRNDKSRRAFFAGIVQSKQVRLLLLNGILVTFVFFAHTAFRYLVYDGELLPNTYYAKQGGFWGISPRMYVYQGLAVPLLGVWGVAAALAGFMAGIRRFPKDMVCVVVMTVTGGLLPFMVGTDWMVGYRLMVPYIPAAAVMVAGGWILLLSRVKQAGPLSVSLILSVLVALLWVTQNASRESYYSQTRIRAEGYKTGHTALAEWIRSRARPGDCIALMDVGIIGYTCIDQNILDITGLTDRYIAKSEGAFLKKEYDPDYIFEKKPRFIVITLFARGKPYTIPAPGTQFLPWTGIEGRLIENPCFQESYVRQYSIQPGETVNWLDRFAAHIGAERAFEHGHPRMHCVQAVFCRQTDPVGSASGR